MFGFVHMWKREGREWCLYRVISYGHELMHAWGDKVAFHAFRNVPSGKSRARMG